KFEKTPTISQAIVELKNAIFKARNQIKSLQTETGNDELDTTVSAGIVCASPDGKNRFLVVAHVGDSRIYKYNPETAVLIQLTKDHSLVGALLAAGVITIQEAHQHPHRNQIYKSVGSLNAPKDIDILVIPLQAGDIYFAMSDGIPDNISPSGLPVAITEEYQKSYDRSSKRSNLRMLAKALIQRAQNIMSTLSQHSKYDDACVAILKAPD
ncbi:SpoIIE family protein phosphatase, partial [Candidatus Dojkabacteria bacterium]|nr:SpoIIE family protein phosphatase [Candidatus Dojkabacteria bacterium]